MHSAKGMVAPRGWARLAGAVAGLLVFGVWVAFRPQSAVDAGLGIATVSAYEQHSLGQVYLMRDTELVDAARSSAGRTRVLWLGASQLYAINEYRPGEHTAPYLVFERLWGDGVRLLTLAQANMFPEEHAIAFTSLLAREPVEMLVVGAVYDDMREDGLREWVRAAKRATSAPSVPEPEDAAPSQPVGNADLGRDGTLMAASEKVITDFLERTTGAETLRLEGRAQVLLAAASVRRWFESLRARYTRDLTAYRIPIPPNRYGANRAAWESLLSQARDRGIRTLVYIAPRPTDFFPYDPQGYEEFKRDIASLAAQYGAAFANFEDLVPSDQYGQVDIHFGYPVRDPFHFNAVAHDTFARAIEKEIRSLRGGPAR